jgi:carboxymethylenebutenolidase
MRAAESFGEPLRGASLLHPTHLVTDDPGSPHLAVSTVRAELFLGYGEKDVVTPLDTIPPLREQLEQHGVPHTIEVFTGAAHGYTMPHHMGYNRAAAEKAWEGTLALFARTLPASA